MKTYHLTMWKNYIIILWNLAAKVEKMETKGLLFIGRLHSPKMTTTSQGDLTALLCVTGYLSVKRRPSGFPLLETG